ncbi:MAG: 2-amino-4-hydroxy-6-hydroxymethyldihydropteridine diphosphokinase [Bacteroidetes bacterium]|nr:2-amino-4-hydroxy-6-hydroxymethyldihydropteridine diphosphokinase [Bacteroidota bacterium]
MKKVYLLIGSNVGNRTKHMEKARQMIESKVGKITNKSRIYETEPWGEKGSR